MSLILALTIAFSLSSVTCFASDTSSITSDGINGGPSGSLPARPEVIAEWQATNNEAAELAELRTALVPTATNATWVNISGFVYYGQQMSDSCGAAAVRMALRGLTGTAPAESVVRTGCQWVSGTGTYMDKCRAYLNGEQSLHTYDDKYSILKSLFNNNLYNAISDGAPPIVGIAITEDEGWFYDTSGHALTIYGVLSDKSEYKIADPWGGYVNMSAWKQYEKSSSELWTAYDRNQGYIA